MEVKNYIRLTWRFLVLTVLFIIFFALGSVAAESHLPDIEPEPGLVSPGLGMLIIGAINTFLLMSAVHISRYSGWRLMIGLAPGCNSGRLSAYILVCRLLYRLAKS